MPGMSMAYPPRGGLAHEGEVALCLRGRRRPLTVQEKQWRPAAGLVPDFYVETLATTIRAISGLSRQTPSLRMTKSAGSKTCPLDEVQHHAIRLRPLRSEE